MCYNLEIFNYNYVINCGVEFLVKGKVKEKRKRKTQRSSSLHFIIALKVAFPY